MNNEIQITVIIDAYNYGAYIEDAISSAIQQTFPREQYEVIVVDDGSTDDTRQRVSKYLPDIVYIYKENGGQASAFNAGIAIARGEFVAFLDADDYWFPDKLNEVMKAFRIDPCIDVVYNQMNVVDEINVIRGVSPHLPDGSLFKGRPIEYSVHHMAPNGNATSGIAWRKSALESLLPIPDYYRICADGYLMICAPMAARKFIMLNKILGCYRIHGENLYTSLSMSDYVLCSKSDEVAARYRRLFLDDLLRLASISDHKQTLVTKELKAYCFADELVAIQKHSGFIPALVSFFTLRLVMTELPFKARLFRSVTILLRLSVSENLYEFLRRKYANSLLYCFVQRYVRSEIRFK